MQCMRWNCRAHGRRGTGTTNMPSHRVYMGRTFIGEGKGVRGERRERETET